MDGHLSPSSREKCSKTLGFVHVQGDFDPPRCNCAAPVVGAGSDTVTALFQRMYRIEAKGASLCLCVYTEWNSSKRMAGYFGT